MFSVPYGQYEAVKSQIIDQCFINNSIFQNWNTGRTEVPPLAIPVIIQIAKDNGLEIDL
jgi:hypothetical protein